MKQRNEGPQKWGLQEKKKSEKKKKRLPSLKYKEYSVKRMGVIDFKGNLWM